MTKEFVVLGFDSRELAEEARSGSTELDREGVLHLDGAALAYRRDDGRVEVVQPMRLSPAAAEVPGLDAVPTWTTEQAMSAGEQPRSVAVIGGGPAGSELAYLFAVLGSRVTVVQRNARLIPREEPKASASIWPSGSPPSASGCGSATRRRRPSAPRPAPG